jgi:hypothetical protein
MSVRDYPDPERLNLTEEIHGHRVEICFFGRQLGAWRPAP